MSYSSPTLSTRNPTYQVCLPARRGDVPRVFSAEIPVGDTSQAPSTMPDDIERVSGAGQGLVEEQDDE